MKIIALEEEFTSPALMAAMARDLTQYRYTLETSSQLIGQDLAAAFVDLGDQHIAAMDAAGIDLQVLSFTAPQLEDPVQALEVFQEGNNRAARAMAAYPSRFSAFAALPLADPQAAVDELERAVKTLGFVGGFVAGSVNGHFLDASRFWPVLECAEALCVPIYLHPYFPLPGLMESYFKGREELGGPEWGFMIDASCHFMRMVAAGVFDRFPDLKIILGHLGESIPYNLVRIENRLSAFAAAQDFKRSVASYFMENLVVTTSGNFSAPSLLCAIQMLGIDNIMFSVDWPNESNAVAVDFLRQLPLAPSDRDKIAYQNAERLLGIALP